MTKTLISVIIPTYKNRGTLSRAIDSVLKQDYPYKEIIVVDDNDPISKYRIDTEKTVSEYNNINIIRYIKHPKNMNGAAARNTGIENSNGEIICFLDDDDFFLEGKLSLQINYLLKSNFEGVYCGVIINEKKQIESLEGDLSQEVLLLEAHLYTPTLMLYKKSILSINGFDTNFKRHQDYEFLLRFFDMGYKIGCVKKCLVEIGKNNGENSLIGNELENLKINFFSKFEHKINVLDLNFPGFKSRLLNTHYNLVFLSHIKNKHYLLAIKIFFKYLIRSPQRSIKFLFRRSIIHINRVVLK